MKTSHPADTIIQNRSFDKRHCFLCGVRLGKKNNSREHIFPKFVLHAFDLWNQQLTLVNGTTIPYRKVVIPCCRICNNEHIGKIDKRVSEYFKGGYSRFRRINETLLFQWISRILYCILYLELIKPRDPRFKRRKILKRDFFRRLETVYLFLNSVRVRTKFQTPPWSICFFKMQACKDRHLNFDFKDNPLLLTISLRMNDIGIVAALQDNGALKAVDPMKTSGCEPQNVGHFTPASSMRLWRSSSIRRVLSIGHPNSLISAVQTVA
jgi:hypothetical protein